MAQDNNAQDKTVRWEAHEEGHEGWLQSVCWRFEIRMDQTYGYYTLHYAGDGCESLGESSSISELTGIAEHLIESGQARAA